MPPTKNRDFVKYHNVTERCHSGEMKNPEKWEGHFRIFTFAGKRVKLSMKEGYFYIKMLIIGMGI